MNHPDAIRRVHRYLERDLGIKCGAEVVKELVAKPYRIPDGLRDLDLQESGVLARACVRGPELYQDLTGRAL